MEGGEAEVIKDNIVQQSATTCTSTHDASIWRSLWLSCTRLHRTLTSPPSSKNSNTFAMSPSFTEVWMSTLNGFGGAAIKTLACLLVGTGKRGVSD